MYAMSTGGKDHIEAGADQQLRSRASRYCRHCLCSQSLQLARGQVFFPQLNVIHSGSSALADLFQQALPLLFRCARELRTIRDAVKQQRSPGMWHSGLNGVAHLTIWIAELL